ncbi:STAS domain-containing protein [Nocardia callitridis]|uniref:STAS domain-containing protein n=1 Tax=Nocardia callitridis TaxID=648753 RepID=A0ABP9K734_9NOCA
MSAMSVLPVTADGVLATGAEPGFARESRTWSQRVDRREEFLVVRVEGELDAAAFGEFFSAVERALSSACRAVVIDLRAAGFLSIRAAAWLGGLRERVSVGGPDVRLVSGRPAVERALELTGVRQLFRHYPSMSAALVG